MISKETVEYIAKLACLNISGEETEKLQKNLGEILEYIKLLEKADVSGISISAYSGLLKNVTREDITIEQSKEAVNNILNQAPSKKEGYIKVKKILG